jgi:pimeloyl-ACP methyl ester carboxylesterase
MFNELRADPFLRQHFQFWFYFYPTAVPFLSSAADLRDSLARLRTELDPGHCDPCLDNMVFVGHSMGGLMSRLMTIDSGDDFWRLISRRPFEELKASEPVKHELARTFFFERQTCVKRAVFLATPHRGSKLSPSLPARIARKFMSVPRSLLLIVEDVAKANPPEFLVSLKPESAPTSLDLLAPDAPSLLVLDSRPRSPEVHYHSVIGVAPPCGLVRLECLFSGACEEGDGVVPYASAHVDAVDSELIVPAEHSAVHHHPLAVQEVRKILLEHLKTK